MRNVFGFLLVLFFATSCKRTTEDLQLITARELYPVAVGKTFFYRLDSTVAVNFGSSLERRSYHAKDSIESSFNDAQGKPSFRIFRYLRDTLNTKPWAFCATYVASFNDKKLEYVDNNLRFIPLTEPITTNTSWKGNVYINTVLPSPYYFLDNWDYTYKDLDKPYTVRKGTFQNTYTVLQQDVQTPATFNAAVYNEKSYSIEVYAKGVGLIYKDFLHYIWQPTPTPARYQDDSYGIRLSLIDYR
jgi:hypothetical protein